MNLFAKYFFSFWVFIIGLILTAIFLGWTLYVVNWFGGLFPKEIRHGAGKVGVLILATAIIFLIGLGLWHLFKWRPK